MEHGTHAYQAATRCGADGFDARKFGEWLEDNAPTFERETGINFLSAESTLELMARAYMAGSDR